MGRGQSTLVGFVLLFGIVVLLLLVLQTSAVPAWNQAVEQSHNERVRGELELLRDDTFRTATTGQPRSQSVTLGTTYPVRPFLINPGDPTGSLRTGDPGLVTIRNATATGETGDYWNGSARSFVDRHLRYRPNYNEYESAPATVFENTVLYNEFGDGDRRLPSTGAPIVSDRRITLVTLNGTISRGGRAPLDLSLSPLSAPATVTTVESDGPLVLTAPTQLTEATWRELLAEERASADGYVTGVTVTGGDPGRLRLELAADTTYDLRLARVGIGTGGSDPPAHYLTTAGRAERRLPAGTTEVVAVEVRDRFNNPVSGVRVDATTDGPGTVTPLAPVSDDDGEALFRYESPGAGTERLTATFGSQGSRLREANVTLVSTPVAGGGGGANPGPETTAVGTNVTTASGDPVARGTVFELTATVSDFERGGLDVVAAEWYSNRTVPGGGPETGTRLGHASGDPDEFDSVEEAVSDTVDTTGWTLGRHAISVRGQDANGTWGPAATYVVNVTAGGTGGGGGSDPGPSGPNAFDDANGNGQFDAGETTYTKANLEDGFDDTSVDLVVPSDVGTFDPDGNEIKARSITLRSGIDSRGSNEDVTLTADRDIDIAGQSVLTRGSDITIRAGEQTAGRLVATGASIDTNKQIEFRSRGDMLLDGATVRAGGGSDATADLRRGSATIFVDGATIRDNDNTLRYQPTGVSENGTPTSGSVAPN